LHQAVGLRGRTI